MFVKFANLLIDVSNGEISPPELRGNKYAVILRRPHNRFYTEEFITEAEADKRFTELTSLLCQNRECQIFMMLDSIIKVQGCLLDMQKVFNAYITKLT